LIHFLLFVSFSVLLFLFGFCWSAHPVLFVYSLETLAPLLNSGKKKKKKKEEEEEEELWSIYRVNRL